MSIRLSCPSCQRILEVPVEAAGQTGTCPGCGQRLRVPGGRTALAKPYSPGQRTTLDGEREERGEAGEAGEVDGSPDVQESPATPFAYDDEEEPRRRSLLSSSVPVWGTFLIVLIVFLGGVGWGGWRLYDKNVRQPRFQEIRELYSSWIWAKLEMEDPTTAVPLGIEPVTLDDLGDPRLKEMNRHNHEKWQRDQERRQREIQHKREEARQTMQEADRFSRQRYGVPAAELPSLLPEH